MGFFGKTAQVIVHPRLGPVTFYRRKGSKNIRLSVSSSRGLLLSYPWHTSFARVQSFLKEHEAWALAALEKIRQRSQTQPALSPQEVALLRHKAKDELPSRLSVLANQHRFMYNKVSIKNNKTNWGSCSGANNINLNLKMMLLPEYLRDYIMLHELCHTRVKNHSSQFWDLLNSLTGGKAKEYARELRTQQTFENLHRGS